jgi:carbon-monoxide dehydrogenase large subunit
LAARAPRVRESEPLVRGAGRYVDDLNRPGQLWAAFVRSPYAHARVLSVDGAIRDVAGTLPVTAPPGVWTADAAHPIFTDEVRYVGQAVALVLAESRAAAVDAAERVDVEWEELPPSPPEPMVRFEKTAGDVDGAFAAAAHVVRARHSIPRTVAAPIEPRGVLVDGSTVWISAQDTYRTRAALPGFEVILPDVGGAFGSKGTPGPEIVAVAAVAQRLGRPVKWIETRTENFLTAYQGRGMRAGVELAFDADGHMLALRAHIEADIGAYLFANSAMPPHTAAMLMCGPYAIPAASVTSIGTRSDRVPTGPCRGAGRPEAAAFLEWTVDQAERELGMELRRRNLIRTFPHRTPLGFSYDSGDYERCLDLALELVEPEHGPLVGTGVAVYVERAGGQFEEARVSLAADGRVVAHSAAGPHGQGHATTFAQIVAGELQIDPDRVELRFDEPEGAGTFGGRGTVMGGSALLLAARELRARLDAGEQPPLEAHARFESDYVFSSGAYAAVVEIDPETGALRVKRIAAVDDPGTIVNHELAEGQVLGGSVHGLGASLLEEFAHDEDGQPLNANFTAYAMPSAAEVPEIRTAFVESPSPLNPLGAKGIGEGGAIGVPAALGNAVADAIGGIRVDPPYTPEKLWRASSSR